MAKHDIVLLNTTSSGFETDLGSNIARIKGDANNLLSVRDNSNINKFSISSVEDSMVVSGDLTLSGNLSSSLSSTASFGRIDVTNLVGDASLMTNTNEIGHVSSSAQLAARISGAFQHGFELEGENRVISGSATSTGSFTRVFANVYSGDASDMFNVNEAGHFSGSAQLASDISGSFNKGFNYVGTISGSATSTGSFGRVDISGVITGNASQVTGVDVALPSGIISSSAQVATAISGAFTSGFQMEGTLSGSTSNSTASFGRYDFGSSITITDVSELTGVPSSEGFISSSAQIASKISGSFTKGFEFDGTISGSATSTGSFQKLNFKSISVTDVSGITNHEAGHITGSGGIASEISASIESGYDFTGLLSGSSDSTLIVHKLDLSTGTFNIPNKKLTKNWNSSYVRVASFGDSLASSISGSFNRGFGFTGQISGSAKSTGSFHRTHIKEIFTKNIFTGVRKSVSGSMDHDNYITGSFKTDSSRPINIPTFGRGHTVNTQQFTATGSMENQKYRAQAGQLFIDNFGRLNITVQTGSMVSVAGTWEAGPTSILNIGPGAAAATGTPNAIIQSSPYGYAQYSGSAIYDGISWFRVSDTTGGHGAYQYANCSIGTVDAALFLRHTGGVTFGTNTGKYGSFPSNPAHATFQEDWDGIGWTRGPKNAGNFVKRNGTSGKVGSVNSHIAFNGDDYPTAAGTAAWNGVTWQEVGPHTPVARDGGAGFGGVYDGVIAGGVSPNNTCVDEWNGSTFSTATALPTGQTQGGGAGPQTAGIIMGGNPAKEVQEWNGSAWSEGTSIPVNFPNHVASGGNVGKAFVVTIQNTYFWTGGFVTGSADTYNDFSQNPSGRYLLTKKLQANYSPGCAGGPVTSGSGDNFGYGGGY